MNKIRRRPKARAIWLSAVVALSLTLGGCWEAMFMFGLAKEPSKEEIDRDWFIDGFTGESRYIHTYADGHQKWTYTDPHFNKSVMILEADGSVRSHTGPVDPRTVDKKIHRDRITSSEKYIAKWRKQAVEERNKPDGDPTWARASDSAADDTEKYLESDTQDYIAKYGEVPPSIYDVPGATPTEGVAGADAFTPPKVPTGPATGAIVRPPMPMPHID